MQDFKERLCWYGICILAIVPLLTLGVEWLAVYVLWRLFKGGQIMLRKWEFWIGILIIACLAIYVWPRCCAEDSSVIEEPVAIGTWKNCKKGSPFPDNGYVFEEMRCEIEEEIITVLFVEDKAVRLLIINKPFWAKYHKRPQEQKRRERVMNVLCTVPIFSKHVCRNCREFFPHHKGEKSVWCPWCRDYCSRDCAEQYTGKFVRGLV